MRVAPARCIRLTASFAHEYYLLRIPYFLPRATCWLLLATRHKAYILHLTVYILQGVAHGRGPPRDRLQLEAAPRAALVETAVPVAAAPQAAVAESSSCR